jgi:hypothetical protein
MPVLGLASVVAVVAVVAAAAQRGIEVVEDLRRDRGKAEVLSEVRVQVTRADVRAALDLIAADTPGSEPAAPPSWPWPPRSTSTRTT